MRPVIVFECDDCEAKVECDVPTIRRTASAQNDSDFIMCWRYMQGIGWRTFKRIGHPWTFHCPACGPTAEMAHREHKRQEIRRDQLRHKNARE